MTSEELHIKNIENGIRAIRFGSKTPEEAKVGMHLAKLKAVNEGMHDDLLKKYVNVKNDWDLKNKK